MPENITSIVLKEEIYQVRGSEAISHTKCTTEVLERAVPVTITEM